MVFRSTFAALLLAGSALAQISSFPKPSYFRETFSKTMPKVELAPVARLSDFVVGDKLELSLRNYLELVIANNTDVQIAKISTMDEQNAITRAFGTWDPRFTASFNSQRTKSPATGVLEGATTVVQLSQPAQFQWSQTMPTGTQYNVSYAGQKISSNSGFQNYNPALTSNLGVSFVQPLIRNRGSYVNKLTLMIARSRLRKSEYDMRTTMLQLINDAESAYWDVILARENLKVQQSALDLANAALERARKELELGALSPLDIFNPEQQAATAKITVSQAVFRLRQVEDALRKMMGADLDPDIRKLPIVLTETVMPATSERPIDAEMSVEKALSMRPDLKSALQNLDFDDLSIRQAQNGLLPDLSLTGAYTTQGRGGTFYQRGNVFTETGTSTFTTTIPGGFGDALNQMFNFGYPVYAFGLRLTLPIRDHRVAADLADAVLAKKRDALAIRNAEQQIRLDVLNAVSQVESSKAAVQLAVTAADYAKKYLDAEQKKYELGTSQIFFVLQAQSALVSAESTVVQNSVSYRRNMLNLLRRTGELLEERGIVVQ